MSAVCTHEEKRVFRLISMMNGEGTILLRLCLIFLLPELACMPLVEYLDQADVKKRLEDALYKSKVITVDQFNILYPKLDVPYLESLDITLLVFLARQLHPFLNPSNKIWTDPPDGNTSLEADIARLRDMRNTLSHMGMTSLSETEFEQEYIKLESILCRIAESVGGSKITPDEMKDRLNMKKNGTFETKPVQIDISTNVSDSLERRNKSPKQISVEDKTTCTSSLPRSETSSSQQNVRRKRCCTLSKLCLFQSCCEDSEPMTVLTNDHSSMRYRCSISSLAVLHDGTVLATDSVHNLVEAFTPSGQPFEEYQCPSPNSVCVISHDTVAVSLFKERKLIVLNILFQSRKMISKVEYDVKCTCDLISIKYSSGFLYVLCEKGEVHAVNKNTGAEQALYQTNIQKPSYFDITSDGNLIYISKGHKIICMGLPGNIYREYIDANGRELKGIVARSSKVYAAVWDGSSVIKLNEDLRLVKNISIDNVQNPMALCKFKGHLYLSKYRTDLDRYMCREIVVVKA